MRVNRVLETCLYVDDLAAAEAFYTRVLGLRAFSRVDGRHVFFRCGDGLLLLFNATETRKRTGDVPSHGAEGQGHIAFAMQRSEIEDWLKHLEQQDIVIEAEVSWGQEGYSIYFRDPAGNSLELTTPETWGFRT